MLLFSSWSWHFDRYMNFSFGAETKTYPPSLSYVQNSCGKHLCLCKLLFVKLFFLWLKYISDKHHLDSAITVPVICENLLKPHCIRFNQFKVDHVSARKAAGRPYTHCWSQRHSVTALATYTITLVTAWMPGRKWWRLHVDLLVPAGTGTGLNWIQCDFNTKRVNVILGDA
jgi:hypothetical protein